MTARRPGMKLWYVPRIDSSGKNSSILVLVVGCWLSMWKSSPFPLHTTLGSLTPHTFFFFSLVWNLSKLNGPAPDCAPSPCLACQGRFRTVFDQLLGMQFQLAGITERIPVPCSEFYPVVHDPCVGIKTTENEEEEDPTPTATEDDALTSTTTVAAEDDADNGSSSAAGPVVLFRTMLLTSTLFLGMMMLS